LNWPPSLRIRTTKVNHRCQCLTRPVRGMHDLSLPELQLRTGTFSGSRRSPMPSTHLSSLSPVVPDLILSFNKVTFGLLFSQSLHFVDSVVTNIFSVAKQAGSTAKAIFNTLQATDEVNYSPFARVSRHELFPLSRCPCLVGLTIGTTNCCRSPSITDQYVERGRFFRAHQ
jgi:hypothetical protein